MNKNEFVIRDRDDAHSAADSLRTDFEKLIGIFERQLAAFCEPDAGTRRQIEEARTPAARGLELSRQLTRLLAARD